MRILMLPPSRPLPLSLRHNELKMELPHMARESQARLSRVETIRRMTMMMMMTTMRR